MQVIYLLITGLLAGIVGSLFGLGGGIIMVPALILIFDLPATEAVGTSLMGVVAVSTAASIDFLKSGRADLQLGLTLETATVLGALISALAAAVIPAQMIYILFSVILCYTAFNMVRSSSEPCKNSSGDFPRNMGIGIGLSFVAGNVAGLLGVGGGIIKVPIMNIIMRVPLKIAMATSSYMIGITAAPAAIIYLLRGDADINKASAIILGIFFGSRLGASISYRINVLALRLLFVGVMLYTALRMIIKGI